MYKQRVIKRVINHDDMALTDYLDNLLYVTMWFKHSIIYKHKATMLTQNHVQKECYMTVLWKKTYSILSPLPSNH